MDESTSPILWTQRHTLQKDTAYLKYVSHGGILDDMRKLRTAKKMGDGATNGIS
jgi:hypothetical protein